MVFRDNGSLIRRSIGKISLTGKAFSNSPILLDLIADVFRRKQEAHINSVPNFKTQIKDEESGNTFSVHFAALFSKKPDAIPIVLFHGWPGSFLEFFPIMDLVRKKYSPEELPYHIIAPSLPGYTLSDPPPLDREWRLADSARIMHKLLLSLGFGETGYIVQGGDVGSMIARTIAVTYAECKAMHLNFMFMSEPPNIPASSLTAQEKRGLEKREYFHTLGSAYGKMHGSRPSTIGIVLSSSPVALLAWVGEKFLEWTDDDLPIDTVLTDISLYWLTECFPTSIYTYKVEQFEQNNLPKGYFHGSKEMYVDKPSGYSFFPQEITPIPRAWAETSAKLVSFRAHEKGGHFAALEKPEELLEDIEEFVKKAWK